mgnify:CR=1 FL=1
MGIVVLLVNYNDEAQKLYLPLLSQNSITIHSAATMQEALIMLMDTEYSCVVINGDCFEYLPLLKVMRRIITIPIGVSVSRYNQDENHSATPLPDSESAIQLGHQTAGSERSVFLSALFALLFCCRAKKCRYLCFCS